MLPTTAIKRPFLSTDEDATCKRPKHSDFTLHDLALAAILKRVLFGPQLDKNDFYRMLPEQNHRLSWP